MTPKDVANLGYALRTTSIVRVAVFAAIAHEPGRTVSELTQELDGERSTVAKACDHLRERGIVIGVRQPGSHCVRLELTPTGIEIAGLLN